MGRSRTAFRTGDDDPNQSRAKKKKVASGPENAEAEFTAAGRGINEGTAGLYHCNYCNKDISGKVRIKCAACPDFDLCIECFSVGAEITPHKSNHPYRVMDNLSFPLICPDWNVDEEMLLLEAIEMYGFGNWAEVADYVGSKSKSQCIDHYNAVYMNSPHFPLPDLTHVMGKNKEELIAMAKELAEVKEDSSSSGELPPKEEPVFSTRAKSVESEKEVPVQQLSSSSTAGAGKRTSHMLLIKDEIKEEGTLNEPQVGRIGEKKPRLTGDEGPSMSDLGGYNFKRQEFEIEYDNDAEQLLADMEFRDTDTDAERELKLQVLRIYSRKLDERKRRKDFILERNLLYPDHFEKNLPPEERGIYKRLKVFTRYHCKEDHEELLKSVIQEHQILRRIQQLQEARAAGCRTAAEANKFIDDKREREAEESSQRAKESAQAGPSSKVLPRLNYSKSEVDGIPMELLDWDISDFPGAELLSETEKRLCREIRLLPAHYLKMLHVLSMEIKEGKLTKKSDAYSLFKVDPTKTDRVYDMLVSKRNCSS
ncbi:transcriptional adapter ADA2a isoform X1 [Punica granatum]|uniref:Transcriptional adapter n=1 Tax=Punica granatum TaxID=22663 RepID=A0A6P8DD67_PUNGR|nr:transcriptional adapter ADA2a isoform X1 [Punica granatum]